MAGLTPLAQWLHIDWMLVVDAGLAGWSARPACWRCAGWPSWPACCSRWAALVGLALFGVALDALLGSAGGRGAADRPARACRSTCAWTPVGLLPDGDRRRRRRHLGLRGRLLPPGRGHAAGAAVPGVPRVPGQHGAGDAGRRRLRLHGDVGDDGAVVVLPGHRQPPHPRDPPRRLPVPADRAHRRHRASCCASACCRPTPATTPSPTCARRHLSPFWASVAFLLALFGFGAKAGILPLHIWLPEAHPAAPSPVSALMSGVMLKTAIYGLLRVAFDLLQLQLWWWGVRAAGARPGHRAVRRGVRRGADRHEAPARLFVDREHRPALRRHRPGADLLRPTACSRWPRWR